MAEFMKSQAKGVKLITARFKFSGTVGDGTTALTGSGVASVVRQNSGTVLLTLDQQPVEVLSKHVSLTLSSSYSGSTNASRRAYFSLDNLATSSKNITITVVDHTGTLLDVPYSNTATENVCDLTFFVKTTGVKG